MLYNTIYIGGSLCNLIHCMGLSNNILILEKENYLGGAWNITKYDNKEIETGIHLIVPPNNSYYEKFNKYFNKFDINFEKISNDNFIYETKTFTSYGKDGDPLICSKGWSHFFNQIEKYVQFNKNIEIRKNESVLRIEINKNNKNCIITNKNIYYSDKVIIPVYCNLNKITYDNNIIDLPYEEVVNIHFIITINISKILLTLKFQGFYDKEPIGIYDRISVANISDTNIILLGRISKNYKKTYFSNINKNKFYDDTKKFLLEKNIIDESSIISNIIEKKYHCAYRVPDIRNSIVKIFEKFDKNSVEFLQTHYMGHFLANYYDNLITS